MALRALTRYYRAFWHLAVVRVDGCQAFIGYPNSAEPAVEHRALFIGGELLVQSGGCETQRWRRVRPLSAVGVVTGLLVSPQIIEWSKLLDVKVCWQFLGLKLHSNGEVPATAVTTLFHRDQTDSKVLSILADCALILDLCKKAHTDPRNFAHRLLRIQDGGCLE